MGAAVRACATAWQEVVAMLIFTVEYLLRLSVCTARPRVDHRFWSYVVMPAHLIDLGAIVPFYIELYLGAEGTLGILRILRLARVFRVLKAGGVLQELRLFVWGYKRAREGLLLLLFLFFLYVNVFGAVMFLMEYDIQTDACFGQYADVCYQDLVGSEINSPGCAPHHTRFFARYACALMLHRGGWSQHSG
jgi:hypothetical protein